MSKYISHGPEFKISNLHQYEWVNALTDVDCLQNCLAVLIVLRKCGHKNVSQLTHVVSYSSWYPRNGA